MGLDAFVPCNCYQEGRTTPPPVPSDYFELDEGYYLLKQPYAGDSDLEEKLYQWTQQCCPHSGMHISERISNWVGLRSFQQALDKLGIHHFPVLGSQLPSVNGGSLGVEGARQALTELETFESMSGTLSNVYLINADKDIVMYDYIEVYAGQFVFANPYSMGFNDNGLYITESESRKILFQGKRVTQEVFFNPTWWLKLAKNLRLKKIRPVRKVCWTNIDTGEQFYTP